MHGSVLTVYWSTSIMTEYFGNSKEETVEALAQVDSILKTIQSNKWKQSMISHLTTVKYELERQLTFMV